MLGKRKAEVKIGHVAIFRRRSQEGDLCRHKLRRTSPVEPSTRMPTSHGAPAIIPSLLPQTESLQLVLSLASSHTCSCSPKPIDAQRMHLAPPLLSQTSRKQYPPPIRPSNSQPWCDYRCCPEARWTPVHLLMDSKPLHILLDTGGSSTDKKAKRESAPGNLGAKWTKKRAVVRSGSPSSDVKKGRGVESHPQSEISLPRHGGISRVSNFGDHPRVTLLWPVAAQAIGRHQNVRTYGCAQPRQPARGSSTTLAPVSMDAADAEFHASLTGMLIEALATHEQRHGCLNARSKGGLLMDIAAVLEGGRARCGMVQKVDDKGERSRHKLLESRWFCMPERDEDPERASLISFINPTHWWPVVWCATAIGLLHSCRAVLQATMLASQDLHIPQSTQYSGSQGARDASSHLWGFLQPCSTLLKRIHFFKVQPTVSIGRNSKQNEIILPGGKAIVIVVSRGMARRTSSPPRLWQTTLPTINDIRIGGVQSSKKAMKSLLGPSLPNQKVLRTTVVYTSVGQAYTRSLILAMNLAATVMKAISCTTSQWLAIKMIHESKVQRVTANNNKSDGDEAEHAFMREITIFEDLDHPN
ncbi:hypothetical protein HD554DRAFT_2326050, partial [Boletus coccyginus]